MTALCLYKLCSTTQEGAEHSSLVTAQKEKYNYKPENSEKSVVTTVKAYISPLYDRIWSSQKNVSGIVE